MDLTTLAPVTCFAAQGCQTWLLLKAHGGQNFKLGKFQVGHLAAFLATLNPPFCDKTYKQARILCSHGITRCTALIMAHKMRTTLVTMWFVWKGRCKLHLTEDWGHSRKLYDSEDQVWSGGSASLPIHDLLSLDPWIIVYVNTIIHCKL